MVLHEAAHQIARWHNKKFVLVRIYPNGEYARTQTDDVEGAIEWVEYNSVYRFGQTLYVNGHLVHEGGGGPMYDRLKEIEANQFGPIRELW